MLDFGEKIGVAFQLIDDVIDSVRAEETGKAPGTDLRSGVADPAVALPAPAARPTDADAAALVERIERRRGLQRREQR